ncbi:UNVERIFIED_CONTAM: hypothetical protein B566_EDAN017905 [Ephemera danica]|nr:hypothetical protein B566_EDAN017905 [Ephemera danica]
MHIAAVWHIFHQQFLASVVANRVNLIGEHIDYCGYSVCPMAIKQDILLAAKSTPDELTLRLTNSDPRYHEFEIKLDELRIEQDSGAPEWHSYFLCGLKGVLDLGQGHGGLMVAVTGNIPASSGLSSSSAIVCAAALCAAHSRKIYCRLKMMR